MKKENQENKQTKQSSQFPDMDNQPVPKTKSPPKKKRKKLLKTPSHIIRLCMVWAYVIAIFLLSLPFVSTTLYIKEDLDITTSAAEADLKYASQKEIDTAADELEAALGGLKKSGEEVPEEYEDSMALSSASFDWKYHIANGIQTDRIITLISKSREANRQLYTVETVNALNETTLKAQRALCATVTVTQSALQIILGGSVNNTYSGDISELILSGVMIYALAILPIVGFFISTFDKRRHIKNTYSLITSVLCMLDIFIVIYPNIDIGSVLSVFTYILIFMLSIAGFYAKQQEDYIVKHPELEAEFTEKHPYLVKALINYKAVNLVETLAKKEEAEKEPSAPKTQSQKKKKKKS